MNIVALSHGYPPAWSMGGEISLHRTLTPLVEAGHTVTVLTRTDRPHEVDGVRVRWIDCDNVLDPESHPGRIARQLESMNADVVIAQNELSVPAVKAAKSRSIPSVVMVHTPRRFGDIIAPAVRQADYAVFNTHAGQETWGRQQNSLVLHPPIGPGPKDYQTPNVPRGDAYTLLSNLRNKGVQTVLNLSKQLPKKRFIIVRSPAEPTHGLEDFEALAAARPNVEVHPRVAPEQVFERYLSQTRILLVPSYYETYGMSAIEAAAHGIPSIHVDTPDVREGIGKAAYLIPPRHLRELRRGAEWIEGSYEACSASVRLRFEYLVERQGQEMRDWVDFIGGLVAA